MLMGNVQRFCNIRLGRHACLESNPRGRHSCTCTHTSLEFLVSPFEWHSSGLCRVTFFLEQLSRDAICRSPTVYPSEQIPCKTSSVEMETDSKRLDMLSHYSSALWICLFPVGWYSVRWLRKFRPWKGSDIWDDTYELMVYTIYLFFF